MSDAEELLGSRTTTAATSGTGKRVHYAAHTFARASSLTGHGSTGLPSQSADDSGHQPSTTSRSSRMVLARQTSVSTPTGSAGVALASSLKNGKSGTIIKCNIYFISKQNIFPFVSLQSFRGKCKLRLIVTTRQILLSYITANWHRLSD